MTATPDTTLKGQTSFANVTAAAASKCINNEGDEVANGVLYVPRGPDVCQACICVNGKPAFCATRICGPPSCHALRVKNRCCEWICLDDSGTGKVPASVGNGGNAGINFINVNVNTYTPSGADIGLRLVASSVTAILSLCLLFFLIYRLRRRKMRRHRAHAAALAAAGHQMTSDGDADDGQSIDSVTIVAQEAEAVPRHPRSGYWWKPPEFFENRTAPPSYDDAVMFDGASARVLACARPAAPDDDDYSTDSCGSEAPAYSDIHQDPIIMYPASETGQRNVQLPRGATLVLPSPAPPISNLHHVPDSQRATNEEEPPPPEAELESDQSLRVEETFTAEV